MQNNLFRHEKVFLGAVSDFFHWIRYPSFGTWVVMIDPDAGVPAIDPRGSFSRKFLAEVYSTDVCNKLIDSI
ncbi:hypothetical protein N9D38_04045 [Rubripirellula sp.]|nr:hypothetical protein [Rubripirellula sp.]